MIRRIIYFLLATIIFGGLAGAIAFYAFDFKPKMIAQIITSAPRPAVTIAAEDAKTESWQPVITGIGTLQAAEGIDITPQVGGTVQEIFFDSGVMVKKGDTLVQLDTATDEAELRSLQAQLSNAEIELKRNQQVFAKGYAAKASVDAAQALRDRLAANAERVQAEMKLKTIVAPWDGMVGLRSISVGSYLAPGQKITWLQKTDYIFADFAVTESDFGKVKVGQKVTARFAAYPDQAFDGEIVTSDARVSNESRTITVRAKLPNPDNKLLPGMYADVNVQAGEPVEVITVPQTAVTFSLYGDTVYAIVPAKKLDPNAKDDELAAERRIVKTGTVRDGRIAITKGIEVGDKVVTAGQNKVDQGAKVVINNDIALKELDPTTVQ
ncbi:MAG: efflux RND transporter periplasmic adaptor subunit [Rhizobiales bacterium]|nr:efflux RND transporter periplasmic adaptor subunit [Hyphomicrobiales bacterium]